jgi:hypothetical protein
MHADLDEHIHDGFLGEILFIRRLLLDLLEELTLLAEGCDDAERALVINQALLVADDVWVVQRGEQGRLLECGCLVLLGLSRAEAEGSGC